MNHLRYPHLEHLPIDRECVYALWIRGQLIYIGTTVSPRKRIKLHAEQFRRQGIEISATWIAISGPNRLSMEMWLIRRHKPIMNRTHIYVRSLSNYEQRIKRLKKFIPSLLPIDKAA